MILNSSPKMIPDVYSSNLSITISQLLDKNPQGRPSSEDLRTYFEKE
jgi:hypothetical protein